MTTWFDWLLKPMGDYEKAIRRAAKDKDIESLRGRFIVWVLRDFIPTSPEGEVVAALWTRRLAGDEPTAAEWQEAAQAAFAAADDGQAAQDGLELSAMVSKAFKGQEVDGRAVIRLEADEDPAKVAVVKMLHGKALSSDLIMHSRHCAWSAALVERDDVMRGVVTSAACSGPDYDGAIEYMAHKILSLLEAPK